MARTANAATSSSARIIQTGFLLLCAATSGWTYCPYSTACGGCCGGKYCVGFSGSQSPGFVGVVITASLSRLLSESKSLPLIVAQTVVAGRGFRDSRRPDGGSVGAPRLFSDAD
ncbi:hypothetical protein B842_03685 [Corynebacterium humireducens NBRC 106098 = DSM 45392]|uniref:Uncharacterized protein n=1 Tax=Corynebacterium humireducens NBRC 106098 = DSM 45392 TaxID=1223515 RepID=A0A0B5D174_9CORY|nr:hypothetical protein B842_03685 [Corynebacterium humireducens NBRC 106098 = DSM 45392]